MFREAGTGIVPGQRLDPDVISSSSSPRGTNTVGRAYGPGETTMTRTHKLVNLTGIVLPLVGLVIAVVVLWERMVGPTELAIEVAGVDAIAVPFAIEGVGAAGR